MNKLIVPLTLMSVFGLFNAYSSLGQAQAGESKQQTRQTHEQSAKQHSCGTQAKEFCCKSDKKQHGNCCACCTGSTCAAGAHCCG